MSINPIDKTDSPLGKRSSVGNIQNDRTKRSTSFTDQKTISRSFTFPQPRSLENIEDVVSERFREVSQTSLTGMEISYSPMLSRKANNDAMIIESTTVKPKDQKIEEKPFDFAASIQKYAAMEEKMPAFENRVIELMPSMKDPDLMKFFLSKFKMDIISNTYLNANISKILNQPQKIKVDKQSLNYLLLTRDRIFIEVHTKDETKTTGSFRKFRKAIEFNDFSLRPIAQLVSMKGKEYDPNIVSLEKPDFSSEYVMEIYHIYISEKKNIVYCEYMNGGDLYSLIQKSKKEGNPLSFDERLLASTYVLHGIKDSHKNGYMHRDIKASNFLVQIETQNQNGKEVSKIVKAKVGDLDTMIKETDPRSSHVNVGTLDYIPLESKLQNKRTRSDDIYAFGKTLEKDIFPELFENDKLSDKELDLKNLIVQMQSEKSIERPDASTALELITGMSIKEVQETIVDGSPKALSKSEMPY